MDLDEPAGNGDGALADDKDVGQEQAGGRLGRARGRRGAGLPWLGLVPGLVEPGLVVVGLVVVGLVGVVELEELLVADVLDVVAVADELAVATLLPDVAAEPSASATPAVPKVAIAAARAAAEIRR